MNLEVRPQDRHLLAQLLVGHGLGHLLGELDREDVAGDRALGKHGCDPTLVLDMAELVRDERPPGVGVGGKPATPEENLVADRDGICAQEPGRAVGRFVDAHPGTGGGGGECGRGLRRRGAVLRRGLADGIGDLPLARRR